MTWAYFGLDWREALVRLKRHAVEASGTARNDFFQRGDASIGSELSSRVARDGQAPDLGCEHIRETEMVSALRRRRTPASCWWLTFEANGQAD
jgi:hypothetical protein